MYETSYGVPVNWCYTLTGQWIWTFKNENILRKPVGIALDKNRNVYVAGYETNNVVVLSSLIDITVTYSLQCTVLLHLCYNKLY
jgi:DNA-binding beta-propeller fold protein YncE